MTMRSRELLRFVGTAVRRPGTVGAIAPSAPKLCERLASVVPSGEAANVVELGPGTGSVSAAIGRRLGDTARHVGIECDPSMVAHLRRSHPELEVVHGDATELRATLQAHGMPVADAIISGLPWALFGIEQQIGIVDAVVDVLAEDGVFTTFAYLHALRTKAARRFRELLYQRFDEVLVTAPVWRNTPPAITYVCRRPVSRADAA